MRYTVSKRYSQIMLSFCYAFYPGFRRFKKLIIFVWIVHDRYLAEQRIGRPGRHFGHAPMSTKL